MSQVNAVRRAVAKIRHDDAEDAIPHIGHKQVHHFWPLLSSCFRDVLVAPHQRTDEDAVTWTWREPEDPASPSSAELGGLRRRLREALERFARDVAGGKVGSGPGTSAAGLAGNVEQLEAVMGAMVKELADHPDSELRRFVCRTEHGLRVHSWGAGAPACPTYPDTHGLEISGRVLVAGKPARHDVVLESGDGETIAEVPSDEAGEFTFLKLTPGEYRLRARSVRGTFPPQGLPVELTHRSVKDLVLADARAETVSPLVSARRAAGRRARRTVPLVALGALALAGGWWGWEHFRRNSHETAVASTGPGAQSTPDEPSSKNQPIVARATVPPELRPGTGANGSNAGPGRLGPGATTTARAPRDLLVEGREPAAVGLQLSSAGGAGASGGTPPASGGAGGAAAAGATNSATDITLAPAPAVLPPPVVADGGSPSGRPAVPGAAGAPVAGGPAPIPAPGAPASAAGAASANPKAKPAVPSVSAAARTTAESEPPIAPLVTAETVAPSPPPSSSVVAASATVDVDTPRSEVTREPAVPAAQTATATPREAVVENVIPPADVPVAVSLLQPAPGTGGDIVPLVVRPTVARAAPVPLARTVRVRVSPWRSRLLVDTIVPTAPTPRGSPEPVALLRARLLAEQEARLPQAFRAADGRFGVTLEFQTESAADEALAWIDPEGSPVEAARVSGNRAEILWSASSEDSERLFRLARRDGSVAAEVRVERNGRDFAVRTTEETRTWLRLAVRLKPSVAAAPEPAAGAENFAWRNAAAAPLPPGWRNGEVATADREAIVEAPLGSLHGAVALQSCALFETESGWALVTDVRQAADRPLGL